MIARKQPTMYTDGKKALANRRRVASVVALLSTAALVTVGRPAYGQAITPTTKPVSRDSVRAVTIQSDNVDGETAWLIEQDVRRIPKISGLDRQLPPHIDRRLSYAFDLAQRGATFTADTEFRAVLGLCALELDAREGGTNRREALRQGWIALDEADQFSGTQVDWRESADVRPITVSHTTHVLKNVSTPVDSIQAVQAYYAYAEQKLAFACQGLPGASLAYYGLARTFLIPSNSVSHAAGKSALLHRVALIVAPQNVLAANELAVLLAQHGQLDEAQSLFQQCVAIEATPEMWRNLAVVHARKGNDQASRSALAESETLAAKKRQAEVIAINGDPLLNQPHSAGATAASSEDEDQEKPGIMAKLKMPKFSNPFRK